MHDRGFWWKCPQRSISRSKDSIISGTSHFHICLVIYSVVGTARFFSFICYKSKASRFLLASVRTLTRQGPEKDFKRILPSHSGCQKFICYCRKGLLCFNAIHLSLSLCDLHSADLFESNVHLCFFSLRLTTQNMIKKKNPTFISTKKKIVCIDLQ